MHGDKLWVAKRHPGNLPSLPFQSQGKGQARDAARNLKSGRHAIDKTVLRVVVRTGWG